MITLMIILMILSVSGGTVREAGTLCESAGCVVGPEWLAVTSSRRWPGGEWQLQCTAAAVVAQRRQ